MSNKNNLELLKSYLKDSEKHMSSYGKHHLLKSNYESIENEMNSGTFVKLDKSKIIKYYLSIPFQLLIFREKIFFNDFIKSYKHLCKKQSRLFNIDLIIHSIFLNLLKKREILQKKICVIGDGKANFLHGVLNLKYVTKIYSVNLTEALIQDFLILKKFHSINEDLIKVVEKKEDLLDQNCKVFLIPAQNKNLLRNSNINLFVNTFSFQEMPLTETHNYIDIIKSNNAHLYSLNREEKKMYDGTVIKQTDYGLNRGKIIFEKEAKFVKYFYNSKFPFVHKKKSKVISTLVKF